MTPKLIQASPLPSLPTDEFPPPPELAPLGWLRSAAADEVASSEKGNRALRYPLPLVGADRDRSRKGWMDRFYCTKPCWDAKFCERLFCPYYHCEAERRCAKHVMDECEDMSENPYWKSWDDKVVTEDLQVLSHHMQCCNGGLHVWPSDVREVLEVDLQCGEDVGAWMDYLDWAPRTETVKVVRLVVYGYDGQLALPLFLKCPSFPFLHDIVLPDRKKEGNLIDVLWDLIKALEQSNPRLQHIIFEDADVYAIWE